MTLGVLAGGLAVALFTGAMICAAVRDVLVMTVSDRIVIALLAACGMLAPLAGWPLEEIGQSVGMAMITFFVSVAFFTVGWIGAGHGKLAVVAVLWTGAENGLAFTASMAVLVGACAVGLSGFRRLARAPSWQGVGWVARLRAPITGIPQAATIGLAALSVLPNTFWIGALAG